MEIPKAYRIIATATALSLGLTACAGGGGEKVEATPQEKQQETGFVVEYEYVGGNRISRIRQPNNGGHMFSSYSYCEGQDLIDYFDRASGGGPTRSVDHPACDNNVLTPEDFAPNS